MITVSDILSGKNTWDQVAAHVAEPDLVTLKVNLMAATAPIVGKTAMSYTQAERDRFTMAAINVASSRTNGMDAAMKFYMGAMNWCITQHRAASDMVDPYSPTSAQKASK